MRTRVPLSVCAALFTAASAAAQTLPAPDVPTLNPLTPEKAMLGKVLFWDEQMSSTGTMACATCHIPGVGGTDPRLVFPGPGVTGTVDPGPDGVFGTGDDRIGSPGVPSNAGAGGYLPSAWGLQPQVTGRKAPPTINAAYARRLFWDGRAEEDFYDPISGALVLGGKAALESQAAGPPVSEVEMGHVGIDWTVIEPRLASVTPLALASDVPGDMAAFVMGRGYPALFQIAFGTSDVTASRVAMAIASYQRTLISDDSRFDRWNNGQNPQWLTAQEVAGRDVFFGVGQCDTCHTGALFTDDNFHRLGVRPVAEDPGRGGITGSNGDMGKFKTPGLRNIGLHRSFMHNGGLATLAEVVEFYDRGGDFSPNQLGALNLTPQQKADLVAFMHTLTDDRVANELPPFDRPTLYSETVRVPQQYGYGTAGTGGFVPDALAIEPPLLGNGRWTVAIKNGYGGLAAFLVADVAPAPTGGFPVLGIQAFLSGGAGMLIAGSTPLAGTAPGEGSGSLVVPLPSNPLLAGQTLYLQWVAIDPANSYLLSASQALAATLF